MKIEILILSLISLIDVLFILNNLKKNKDFYLKEKIFVSVLIILFSIIFLFLSSIFFIFKPDQFSNKGVIQIYSFFILINIFLFIKISNKKNFPRFFLFFVYLIFISCYLIGLFEEIFLISFSFFLLLLFSIVSFTSKEKRNISLLGIIFSSFSLFLVTFFFSKNLFLFIVLSFVFFSSYIFLFFKNIAFLEKEESNGKKRSFIVSFLQDFLFVLSLINILFIATLGLHELGHLIPSLFLNCSSQKIIFEEGLLKTFVLCDDFSTKLILTGGFFLPSLIAVFLFLSNKTFFKGAGEIIFGFNLLALNKDFMDIGIFSFVRFFIMFFAVILIIYSIFQLIKSSREIEDYLSQ